MGLVASSSGDQTDDQTIADPVDLPGPSPTRPRRRRIEATLRLGGFLERWPPGHLLGFSRGYGGVVPLPRTLRLQACGKPDVPTPFTIR